MHGVRNAWAPIKHQQGFIALIRHPAHCRAQVEAVVSQSDVVRLLVQHARALGGPFNMSLSSLGLGQVIRSALPYPIP